MMFGRTWNEARGWLGDAHSMLRGDGLGARVVRGSVWTLGLRMATQIASLAQILLVARWLTPGDFGLIGIAMLALGILDMLTEGGLLFAATQRRGDITPYLNTVFTAELARGFLTALGLVFFAPSLANFFHNQAAADVIRGMGLVVLVRAFWNPGMVVHTRAVAFRPSSTIALAALLAGSATTVVLAFLLKSVWALFFGAFVSQLVTTVGSYLLSPYRPRLEFNWARFRDLTRVGKWGSASRWAYYVLLNGDNVLVGRILGTTSLGLYQFAFRVSNLPATEITTTLSQVSFPAYAAIQHDREGLQKMYVQVLRTTALFSLPAATFLLLAAPDLISGVLGPQWIPALAAFQVLCVHAASRSVIATTGPLFQGAGWPSIPLWLALCQIVLLAVIAYPATQRWELVGISVAVATANILALGAAMVLAGRLLAAPLGDIGRALWPGLRAAACLGLALLPIRLFLDTSPLVRLVAEVVVVAILSPVVLLPLVRGWKRPQIGASMSTHAGIPMPDPVKNEGV